MSAPDPTDLSQTREAFLHRATEEFRPWFAGIGFPLPDQIHISVGFPYGVSRENKVILGQTVHSSVSDDGVNHVYICPTVSDVAEVLRILLHSLIHVALDNADGHGKRFADIAVRLGFDTPMTSTPCSPGLAADLITMAETLGQFPHGALNLDMLRAARPASEGRDTSEGTLPRGPRLTSGRPKQDNRWLFLTCPEHGGSYRTSRQWLEMGAPYCGVRPMFEGDDGHLYPVPTGVPCLTQLVPKEGTRNAGERQRRLPKGNTVVKSDEDAPEE